MKKIVKILLAGILALTLVGCSSETIDATSIYENAKANMEALDSYTMESSIVLTTNTENTDGTSVGASANFNYIYTLIGLTSDSVSEYYYANTGMTGEEELVEAWLTDGVLYYNNDGAYKYMPTAEDVEVLTVDIFTYIDDVQAITGTANGDGYSLELTIDESTFIEIMDDLTEDYISELLVYATEESSYVLNMEVNGDGYVTSASVDASVELLYVGIDVTFTITSDFTYYDFDSATLPDFDTESFANVFGNPYYYLTTDHGDDLIAVGYEDLGDDLYANGNYIIDLGAKSFYRADAMYMFAWDYDIGVLLDDYLGIVSGYDFLNFASYNEYNLAEILDILVLRDAYYELASSISESY